jgi:hypothetical protein
MQVPIVTNQLVNQNISSNVHHHHHHLHPGGQQPSSNSFNNPHAQGRKSNAGLVEDAYFHHGTGPHQASSQI